MRRRRLNPYGPRCQVRDGLLVLRFGDMGTAAASKAADELFVSYPSVRRVISAGFCGGLVESVRIGDVVIKPGDVIFADCDGVVCVPRDIAFDVLVRAEEIRANEKKIFGWVAEGQTVHQITKKGGYF